MAAKNDACPISYFPLKPMTDTKPQGQWMTSTETHRFSALQIRCKLTNQFDNNCDETVFFFNLYYFGRKSYTKD